MTIDHDPVDALMRLLDPDSVSARAQTFVAEYGAERAAQTAIALSYAFFTVLRNAGIDARTEYLFALLAEQLDDPEPPTD